ncbi:MAG: helix-turn-helix domain-containing protein [Candidatus Kerfeldbacteria bacterium]|nr:helix-turn-helix domain-containing protein [Candidatus Kerfeldbacteria bacterium]
MSTDIRQKEIQRILEAYGLDQREIAVLFVLIQLNKATASEITKQASDIPRSSIYDLLQSLQHRGFVSSITENDKLYFQVEQIEHVIDILEEEKRALTEQQNAFRSVADVFNQMKFGTAYKAGVRFFEGKKGILAVHREIINAQKTLYLIGDLAVVTKTFPHAAVEDNFAELKIQKVLRKGMMIPNAAGKQYLRNAGLHEYHHVKWLPENMKLDTDTLIWEGHVAIIDYTQHLNTVVIDNPTIYRTFLAWFEMMWDSVSEEITQKDLK